MPISTAKLLSLVIALGYMVAFLAHEHGLTQSWSAIGAFVIIALGLIWFPEAVGNYTGYLGRGPRIDTPTPPILISITGWLFLLVVVPILMYSLWRYPRWW